ncbi:MAG: hypothetical protein KA436_05595 [Oligoflexales bacterium]|nr:hypothetical protein [Oligoflexales bacterium]
MKTMLFRKSIFLNLRRGFFLNVFPILLLCSCLTMPKKDAIDSQDDKAQSLDVKESPRDLDESVGSQDSSKTNKDNIENLELKQARLWARIDTLEGAIYKLQQRMQVLEKNLSVKPVSSESGNKK